MPMQPAILGTARLANFRLGYVPAALARVRRTRARVIIAGELSRVRVAVVSIRDVINDTPNTCDLKVDSPAPVGGQTVRVTVNSDAPRLLFNGTIQGDDLTYEGRPVQLVYPCRSVDDTVTLTRRRPFGSWVDVSATTIALELLANYAPHFTAVHVQAGLPPVSIIYDGTDDFAVAFKRLASAIAGYFYVEDGDLHLFTVESTDVPDPIEEGYPFCDDPPIIATTDRSQLRTRQFGKGHGENVVVDVAAGETILPIDDAVMFNAAGGQAIAGTTPDGAQSQILSYEGTTQRGNGSTVGPSYSPTVAPIVAVTDGAGLGDGLYQVAYTFATVAGETLPSPLASATTGPVAAPIVAPTLMSTDVGGSISPGAHDYAVTFVTASGETLPSPLLHVLLGTALVPPAFVLRATQDLGGALTPGWYAYAVTFVNPAGETSITRITTYPIGSPFATFVLDLVDTSPNHSVTARKIYRTTVQPSSAAASAAPLRYLTTIPNNVPDYGASPVFIDTVADAALGALAPVTNTATFVESTADVLYPSSSGPGIIATNLYRTPAGSAQLKFLASIVPHNPYYDIVADSSLGANAPTVGTAVRNRLAISGVALGPSGTIARKVYRTTANGGQLKLQQTIADNTSTGGVEDATPDGSLGVNAPLNNSSELALTGFTGGGFYTTAPVSFATNGVATNATTSAPVFSSTSYTFVAADVGAQVFIKTGSANWIPGSYPIVSVAAGKATLGRACASVASPSAAIWGVDYSAFTTPRMTCSDLVIDATTPTKFTSASAPVGPHYIGNVLRIANSLGFSEQQVIVIAVAGTVATCDKVLGTLNSINGRGVLGVAPADPYVLAGSPTLITGSAAPFPAAGGWVQIGQQLVRYHGIDGSMLIGIPPTGIGALLDTVAYGDRVTVVPALNGVAGLLLPMLRGTPVHIWVERHDLAAQADEAAIDAANGYLPADGIYDGPPIVDERRGEASLIALCDAALQQFSRPIVTVVYATRDLKTKSGKPVVVNLFSPPIHRTLTIQDVSISEIDTMPGVPPKFTVTATTWRTSLEDLLRRMANTIEAR